MTIIIIVIILIVIIVLIITIVVVVVVVVVVLAHLLHLVDAERGAVDAGRAGLRAAVANRGLHLSRQKLACPYLFVWIRFTDSRACLNLPFHYARDLNIVFKEVLDLC